MEYKMTLYILRAILKIWLNIVQKIPLTWRFAYPLKKNVFISLEYKYKNKEKKYCANYNNVCD